MPWRAIQDSVPYSESLSAVSAEAERLYWRMLAVTDPWGRLHGTTAKVKAICVPLLAASHQQISAWLDELERVDRVQRYTVDGLRVIQILRFEENQPTEFTRRRGKSKFPEPPKTPAKKGHSRSSRDSSGVVRISPAEKEKEKEKEITIAADKPPRESKPRTPNPLWDVLVELVGPVATKTETSLRGKNVKELNLVGATPEEVRRRARNWPPPGVHPDAALTAPALVKYWSALDRRASNGPAPYSKDTFTDRVARGEETEHDFLDEKVIELLKQTGLLDPRP